MTDTFDSFGRLPTELRFMIWRAAIHRQPIRGVHLFTLWPSDTKHRSTCSTVSFGPASYWSRWSEDQESVCMIDSGLWEACHESRMLMKEAYPMQAKDDEVWWRCDAMVTALCADRTGTVRRLNIAPHRDLFMFDVKSFLWAFRDLNRAIDCVSSVPTEIPSRAATSSSAAGASLRLARGARDRRFGPGRGRAAAKPQSAGGNAAAAVRLQDLRNICIPLDESWLDQYCDDKAEGHIHTTVKAVLKIAARMPSCTRIHFYDPGRHRELDDGLIHDEASFNEDMLYHGGFQAQGTRWYVKAWSNG